MTTLTTLKKAFNLLTPFEKRQGLKVLVLVIGMALLETAGVASLMPFLAVLGDVEIINSNPILSAIYSWTKMHGIKNPDQFLILLGIGAFTLILMSAAYRSITQYIVNHFIEMCRHSIGRRLLENYLGQPYSFFLDRHSGDMSKTILSEVDQLNLDVLRPAYNMVAYSFTLIAITTLLIMVNPWLVVMVVGMFSGLYSLIFLILSRKLSKLGRELVISNKERFMAASEAFGGIKDIKLLGRENSYLSRFQGPSKRFASTLAANQTLNQVPNYLIEAIVFGGILLLSIFMLVNAGGLNGGALGQILPTLGLYTFAAYKMKPAVQYIYLGFAGLRYGKVALDSIYSDIHPIDAPVPLLNHLPVPIKVQQSLALENLFYTYPKAVKPALIDLNLRIPVGTSVGIVGSTGAGKTTLVDVILGLLSPTIGSIIVDGKPVTENNLRAWQRSLGYVPQDIFLTDTSVTENIAMGIPQNQINEEQVIRCARMAQVHDFITQELPAKYATLVGERGVRLSGGQRQRIGIARALYQDPDVLVFDEATSALDTVTEKAVMGAIEALAREKTIILIAHRISTVRNCDQIVLLDKGRIRAIGSFEDLNKGDENFRKMVAQS